MPYKNPEKRKLYIKEYRQNNKNKISQRSKKYREKNREKLCKIAKDYYQKNKSRLLKQHKDYRYKNPDYHRDYYEKNREQILLYQKEHRQKPEIKEKSKKYKKEYRQKNEKKIKAYHKKYYKINKDKYKEQWLQIIKEYYGKISCSICGYGKNFRNIDFHHRNPKEKTFCIGSLLKQKTTLPGISSLKKELEKCDLVCNRCHGELHYPQLTLI